jgi:DNA-binding IclR family transcriptional regulator
MALCMSGPLTRMSDEVIDRAVPILSQAAAKIGAELGAPAPAIAAEITHAA